MQIDHMAIYVRDLEAVKKFFMTYFAARSNELYHNPRTGLSTYILSFASGSRLELMTRPDLTSIEPNQLRTGYIHLSMSLGSKEKVDTLTRLLETDGYQIVSYPRTTGDGYYESCIEGPESNLIELTV